MARTSLLLSVSLYPNKTAFNFNLINLSNFKYAYSSTFSNFTTRYKICLVAMVLGSLYPRLSRSAAAYYSQSSKVLGSGVLGKVKCTRD